VKAKHRARVHFLSFDVSGMKIAYNEQANDGHDEEDEEKQQ
jgi:hypothetical protein